ncbi:pentapeptide repeat-containing protein [Helicobacter equorum]|uniref:Pentapeptide repeat-containing protein n=1 Tax=Helicobacter equorum TaxID=361872 RepID=A0A3D8ILB3_9HELI|nr:pentapeptide repeat-containing protein [Helicobacter equorum]RDU65351.1 hypothetical protein CQA54_08745 [Helicobacter equorum]
MKEKFYINEMINNTSIKIVGLDNEILTISLDLADFYNYSAMKYSKESQQNKIDVGDIAKPLHPYAIYKTLENAEKNTYNNTKIIERKEASGFIEYHFNYGLILNVFVSDTNKNISKSIKEKIPKMAFINPVYFSYGIIGDSDSILDDELSELVKDYGYEEQPYRSIFKKEVYINYSCFERVRFSHCEFESKLALYRLKGSHEAIEFHNGINFEHCVFGGEVEFRHFVSGSPLPENKYYNNARETNFKNCIFKKRVDFSNSKICNNIYFTDSIFQDSVDFSQCEFEKTANFYGVKFKKVPNFSQAQFKGSLNAVNANLDFGFESLDKKIREEYETYNHITPEHKGKSGYLKRFFERLSKFFKDTEKYQKTLAHFANDFKDSFRIFKSALIKDNNLLDASEFHRFELYCKEIELRESVRKRGTKAHDNEGIRKNMKPFKEFIDFLLLRFYRNLCDHHTDFLRCFNNLVLLVALYVGCLLLYHNDLYPNYIDIYYSLGKIFLMAYPVLFVFLVLLIIFLVLFVVAILLNKILHLSVLDDIRTGSLSGIKDLVKIICKFVLIFVGATLINNSEIISSFLNITGFFLFFFMYFSLVFLDSAIVRCLIVIIAYMTVSIAIGYKIAILNPLIGKLFTDTLEITDPFLNFITLAYTISMFLVLFSLQKTARKNSIVPN